MNVRLICVGKIKETYIKKGIQEYEKRLSRYCKLEIIEVNDESAPETLSKEQQNVIKQKEGQRIIRRIKQGSFVIVLSIDGKSYTSEEFAQKLDDLFISGKSSIDFIIGGSLGIHGEVLQKADMLLSFSSFTFPHQLMRLILLEQIYRAFKIQAGEPYHK